VIPAAVTLTTIGRAAARRLAVTTDPPMTAWLRRGAIAGLIGIAAQSSVEFSLQLPANALLCFVLMALAIHPTGSVHARRV
jgi:4-amino-4-deoxy-L-arabinose transferase-like glycosyltransferase